MSYRTSSVARETAETRIAIELSLDGTGRADISTGIRMFDHFLTQIARHGMFDLVISASGDDQHHTVEDVAICLGRAFNEALADRKGIVRMAHAAVPMDEALCMVTVDMSGRGGGYISAPLSSALIGDLESDMVRHFLVTLASEARVTLHAAVEYGTNDHHKAEALFKALARALDGACQLDPRRGGEVPSSKGVLDH